MLNCKCKLKQLTPPVTMNKVNESSLKNLLSKHFSGQSQRISFLSKLVLALLSVKNIKYSELSRVVNPSVKQDSNFKRIQRFFKEYFFKEREYLSFVFESLSEDENWIALALDRTNWKFGKLNINFLVVGISWKGSLIPLCWTLLPKRGNSSQIERIELMNRLWKIIPDCYRKKIRYLLMDREFDGSDWLSFLKESGLILLLRVKKKTKVRSLGKSKEVHIHRLFEGSNYKALRKHRVVFGHRMYLAGYKIKGNDYFILISNNPLSQGQQLYNLRWGIEVFFGCLKTRGFNFEDSHVNKLDRINNLLFTLSIAFIWSILTGVELIQKGYKIPKKKIKQRWTKLKSIFRIGLDHLSYQIINFKPLEWEFSVLSCT